VKIHFCYKIYTAREGTDTQVVHGTWISLSTCQ